MRAQVAYVKEGLEAIVFTADGDMRQGLNNLQATHYGFGLVDPDAVFKVPFCERLPGLICARPSLQAFPALHASGKIVMVLQWLSQCLQTKPF